MIHHKQLNCALIAMVCIACAPSGDEDGQTNIEAVQSGTEQSDNEDNEINSTQQLVAQADFDFKSDRTLSLSFEKFPSTDGTFVIYSDFERYDSNQDTYYPDYMTRLAIFIADTELVYNVVVPSDQDFLILEWLPMDGKSHETYQYLALSEITEYVAEF
jgi:hypothetical protein